MDARRSLEILARGCLGILFGILLTSCATQAPMVTPEAQGPTGLPAQAQPEPAAAPPAPPQEAAPAAAPQAPAAPAAPAPAAPSPAPPSAPAPAKAPAGPVELTGIDIRPSPRGTTIVINSDGPIPSYESFALPDPPRLVVDVPNAVHALRQPITVPAGTPIAAIRSSQYKEKPVKVVRLVVDLATPQPYRVEGAGNRLRILLGGLAAEAPAAPTPPVPTVPAAAPPAAKEPARVTKIDYQPVRGKGRVVITTTGKVTYAVTQISEPPSVILDISDAVIDPQTPKSLEVAQIGGPVQRIRAAQFRAEPERVVRVVAELQQASQYAVQESDRGLTLELTPTAPRAAARPTPPRPPAVPPPPPPVAPAPPAVAAAAPSPPPGEAARLSMDFKDADINNLLRIIAEVSGLNVVAGSDVAGKVTIRLTNVDWRQALDVILKINNLAWEQDGNVIRVAPRAKFEEERRARAAAVVEEARAKETAAKTEVALEPPVTKVIPVNYAKASEVVKNLDRLKTPARPDVSIVVDDRTNSLIIQELPATIAKMETLLQKLDVATPQVLIEARLVEATRNFAQSLGVTWGGSIGRTGGGILIDASGARFNATASAEQPIAKTITLASPIIGQAFGTKVPVVVNFPAAGVNTGLGFVVASLRSTFTLGFQLTAAENEGKVRTLSAPRIATLDNEEAEIRQGTQIPYTTIDSSGRTVISFIDAFIRLKVKPHITNDRRVALKLEAERSFQAGNLVLAGSQVPIIGQRRATTNVLVSNGSTIVIGGLLQSTDNESQDRSPFLSRIPVLGWLFKVNSASTNKEELMIFLTPTILEEGRRT